MFLNDVTTALKANTKSPSSAGWTSLWWSFTGRKEVRPLVLLIAFVLISATSCIHTPVTPHSSFTLHACSISAVVSNLYWRRGHHNTFWMKLGGTKIVRTDTLLVFKFHHSSHVLVCCCIRVWAVSLVLAHSYPYDTPNFMFKSYYPPYISIMCMSQLYYTYTLQMISRPK